MADRLQKLIARAGITSRRKAEILITAGRVSVNGKIVQELGAQADLATDAVRVDGRLLQNPEARRYLAINKPKGCITTTSDPEGRTTVMDLLGSHARQGLFPVGRLDYHSEGLLVLTDDGDFANRIMSARQKVPKVYEVKVSGRPTVEAIQKLRTGIRLDGRLCKPERIALLRDADNPWYEVTIVEGRNRQLHRMFERIGFLVEKIRRVRIGSLTLRGLEPRQVRELTPKEVKQLLDPKSYSLPPTVPLSPRGRPVSRPSAKPSGGRRGAAGRGRTRRDGKSPTTRRPRTAGGRSDGPSRPPRRRKSDEAGKDLRRSSRPRQQRGQRQSSAASGSARAGATGRGQSPRRRRAPSRERQSSRPGSKARP